MIQPKWDSCIFDLDGTLWNSVPQITKIWNQAIRSQKIDHILEEKEVLAIMGLNTVEIGDKLFPFLGPEERYQLMMRCTEAESRELPKAGGTLYPEVKQILKELRARLPLFIVSNCDRGYIEAFLAYHQLWEFFRDHLSYGDSGLDKPENIRMIAEKHDLKKPVYIGDTEKDHFSAKQAGVDFIFAAYGFGSVPAARYRVNRFNELPALIFSS